MRTPKLIHGLLKLYFVNKECFYSLIFSDIIKFSERIKQQHNTLSYREGGLLHLIKKSKNFQQYELNTTVQKTTVGYIQFSDQLQSFKDFL